MNTLSFFQKYYLFLKGCAQTNIVNSNHYSQCLFVFLNVGIHVLVQGGAHAFHRCLFEPPTRRGTARNTRRVHRMAHELVWAHRGAPPQTVLAWSRVSSSRPSFKRRKRCAPVHVHLYMCMSCSAVFALVSDRPPASSRSRAKGSVIDSFSAAVRTLGDREPAGSLLSI